MIRPPPRSALVHSLFPYAALFRAAAARVAMRPAGPVAAAMDLAAASARPGDRIVVFGSFHTVGPALAHLGVPL